eukprot:1161186-Pelagomonas_calceolata.AAC.9
MEQCRKVRKLLAAVSKISYAPSVPSLVEAPPKVSKSWLSMAPAPCPWRSVFGGDLGPSLN